MSPIQKIPERLYEKVNDSVNLRRITEEEIIEMRVHYPDGKIETFDRYGNKVKEETDRTVLLEKQVEELQTKIKNYEAGFECSTKRHYFWEIANEYKDELREFISREHAKSTTSRIMSFLCSRKCNNIATIDDIYFYKDNFHHNISTDYKNALLCFIDFCFRRLKMKKINDDDIETWIIEVKKMPIKQMSEKKPRNPIKSMPSETCFNAYLSTLDDYGKQLALLDLYSGMRMAQLVKFLTYPKKEIYYQDREIIAFDNRRMGEASKQMGVTFFPLCTKDFIMSGTFVFPPPIVLRIEQNLDRSEDLKYASDIQRVYDKLNRKGSTFGYPKTDISSGSFRKFHTNVLSKLGVDSTTINFLEGRNDDSIKIIDRHYLDYMPKMIEASKKYFDYILRIAKWEY